MPTCAWVEPLLSWEETEWAKRSHERRLGSAHIGSDSALWRRLRYYAAPALPYWSSLNHAA